MSWNQRYYELFFAPCSVVKCFYLLLLKKVYGYLIEIMLFTIPYQRRRFHLNFFLFFLLIFSFLLLWILLILHIQRTLMNYKLNYKKDGQTGKRIQFAILHIKKIIYDYDIEGKTFDFKRCSNNKQLKTHKKKHKVT